MRRRIPVWNRNGNGNFPSRFVEVPRGRHFGFYGRTGVCDGDFETTDGVGPMVTNRRHVLMKIFERRRERVLHLL